MEELTATFGPMPSPATARLAYGPEPEQFGDLRVPKGPGPHPVAVLIHGGYWRVRYGLDWLAHAAAALCASGIATWNIEYRRIGSPGGGWPGTFEDVAHAADHLRTLAQTYPLDLSRTLAVGHSAGGHLALWLAARHRLPPGSILPHNNPLSLVGAVSLAGVVDLARAYELGLSNGAAGELLGGSPAQFPKRYASASPYTLLPLGINQILIHGSADTNVPAELSERYAQRAQSFGDSASLLPLPGVDHFQIIDPRSAVWPQVEGAITSLVP